MLTVHHLRISQSERIVWLCEELGIDYELKLYDRREDNRLAPDEYKALHPQGIAPVITDGDTVLGESGAIIDYLVGKYGANGLVPSPDSLDFADHCFFFHWSNGTFMASMMMQLVLNMSGAPEGMAQGFVQDRVSKGWQIIEDHLGKKPYFGGENLSTADIMMVYILTTGRGFRGQDLGDRPNTRAYLQRIGERDAYRRAMTKAEPGTEPNLT